MSCDAMLTSGERLVMATMILVHALVFVALAMTVPVGAIPVDLCGCVS